jgi:hypothetical protein
MNSKLRYFLFLVFFFVGNIALAQGNAVKNQIPCSSVKVPLYYAQYGIETPDSKSGWSCFAIIDKKTKKQADAYLWKNKNGAVIKLVATPTSLLLPPADVLSKVVDYPKAKEPNPIVRMYIEAFFGDDAYMEKNASRQYLVNQYADFPKAVFFSRVNKVMAVYFDSSSATDTVQKPSIYIFKNRTKRFDKYLLVYCDQCKTSDLFTFVIAPMIQK